MMRLHLRLLPQPLLLQVLLQRQPIPLLLPVLPQRQPPRLLLHPLPPPGLPPPQPRRQGLLPSSSCCGWRVQRRL